MGVRGVTVSATERSVSVTPTVRSATVSRRYLFTLALVAAILGRRTADVMSSVRRRSASGLSAGSRTAAATSLRWRGASASVAAGRSPQLGFIRRRPLESSHPGARAVSAPPVRRRPTTNAHVAAARIVTAGLISRFGLSSASAGARTARVIFFREQPALDSNGNPITDHLGDPLMAALESSQFRRRILDTLSPGARTASAEGIRYSITPDVLFLGRRSASAAPAALRPGLATVTATRTVDGYQRRRRHYDEGSVTVARGSTFLRSTFIVDHWTDSSGARVQNSSGADALLAHPITAILLRITPATDHLGNPITDHTGNPVTAYA